MRGLALVRTAGLDAVVCADRDFQFLLEIAVEITDQDAEAAVGVREPSFKRASDALSELVRRLEGQLLRPQQSPTDQTSNRPSKRRSGAPDVHGVRLLLAPGQRGPFRFMIGGPRAVFRLAEVRHV